MYSYYQVFVSVFQCLQMCSNEEKKMEKIWSWKRSFLIYANFHSNRNRCVIFTYLVVNLYCVFYCISFEFSKFTIFCRFTRNMCECLMACGICGLVGFTSHLLRNLWGTVLSKCECSANDWNFGFCWESLISNPYGLLWGFLTVFRVFRNKKQLACKLSGSKNDS